MQHLKVMVVDDTSVSRMLLVDGLNEIGIKNIALAADGEQALQLMMAEPLPHRVLRHEHAEAQRPAAAEGAARISRPTRQCCFILVTGKGDRAMIEEGKKYGLNNFLAKPFTPATLKAAIEAVVGKLV